MLDAGSHVAAASGGKAGIVIAGRLCRVPLLSGFSLVCAFCLVATPVRGQQTDRFISTIEKIKSGVAPVICTHAAAPNQFDVTVHGTAFFIDLHGTFLTAAHVFKGVAENKDKSCETPAVLVRANGSVFNSLNLYSLKFVASDCRIDETADIARCKTISDPTDDKKIAAKPLALTIASDLLPDGTPVAFTGFPVNGLTPYTARANVAGYQFDRNAKQDLQAQMLVLDKLAWAGSSGGPVYAADGRVMGMLLQAGNGLAFARPGARLNEFLNGP